MHHMLHHTRNEAYWLAFIVPQVRPVELEQGAQALCSAAGGLAGQAQAADAACWCSCWSTLSTPTLFPENRVCPLPPPCLSHQVDAMFGTAPQPGSVRMSDMAKQGLKASRDAAAATSGASAGSS